MIKVFSFFLATIMLTIAGVIIFFIGKTAVIMFNVNTFAGALWVTVIVTICVIVVLKWIKYRISKLPKDMN